MITMLRLALLSVLIAPPATAVTLAVPVGATLTMQTVEPLGSYALPTGPFADGFVPTDAGEGEITRQAWRLPATAIGTLQLLAPLRAALVADGFDIVLDCETAACGGFDFRFATEVLPPPAMHVDLGNFRFLSARKGDERIGILVSATARAGFVQIIRAGPADPAFRADANAAPVALAASAPVTTPVITGDLAAQLESAGRAILSDLAFPTGSAQLGPGEFPSLQALAAYLAANPGRRVALVGHTDSQGALDANITLSRRRAASVMERLVADYGVPRQQLEAEGMGYLAPIASNLTPQGREANRRVEVIITSIE